MFAVIIAGGRGTRFWPASRKNKPKQLLNIIGEHSMLQMTVDRLRKMKNVEDIFIITGKHLEKVFKVLFQELIQKISLLNQKLKIQHRLLAWRHCM